MVPAQVDPFFLTTVLSFIGGIIIFEHDRLIVKLHLRLSPWYNLFEMRKRDVGFPIIFDVFLNYSIYCRSWSIYACLNMQMCSIWFCFCFFWMHFILLTVILTYWDIVMRVILNLIIVFFVTSYLLSIFLCFVICVSMFHANRLCISAFFLGLVVNICFFATFFLPNRRICRSQKL